MQSFVMGVDEAGRGPLAGPVAVGVVLAPVRFDISNHFPGVADSKVLTEKKREEIYELLVEESKKGSVRFCVRFASASQIDKMGLSKALRGALYNGVRALAPEAAGVRILLDGSLHAPEEYVQETIIRGDASEPIISLASIAAKVRRDRLMRAFAKKYPEYLFDIHKGYGTRKHYAAIAKHGLCDIHRKSWSIGK